MDSLRTCLRRPVGTVARVGLGGDRPAGNCPFPFPRGVFFVVPNNWLSRTTPLFHCTRHNTVDRSLVTGDRPAGRERKGLPSGQGHPCPCKTPNNSSLAFLSDSSLYSSPSSHLIIPTNVHVHVPQEERRGGRCSTRRRRVRVRR